ncbi:hypothetical protein EQV77_05345 [Halobacillus fulvus]|nr:hypothetical protein EQV77_05345 [Halobacillus fulvus]
MDKNDLHPSVQKFKEFVDRQPKVKRQLRRNHSLIQSYYEKWMILGEDDPFWQSLPSAKKESSKKDWMKQLGLLMEDINWEDVSKHMEDLNGAIAQFQQLLSEVKQDKIQQPKEMQYPYY